MASVADQGDDWAAPGGFEPPNRNEERPAPTADAPPRYGERIPGWQQPVQPTPAGPSAGYIPPPRPGLFPLYPLGFGRLLGSAFATIRWNPKATILPAIIVAVVQVGILYGGIGAIGFSAADRLARATTSGRAAIQAGTIVEGAIGVLLYLAVSVFGSALLQGIIVIVVARGGLGERPTFRQVFERARRSVLKLVGYSLLFGVAVGILLVVIVVLIAVAATIGGSAGTVVAVLIGVLGGIGAVVVLVWVGVKLALVPSAIVLERRGVFAGVARSWRLTRHSFWRTLGVIVVVSLMVGLAASIISLPFSILGAVIGGLLAPDAGTSSSSNLTAQLPTFLLTGLPSQIAGTVVSGIGVIAQVAALALVYLDLRMRREGLDIELQAVAETGDAGTDPFLPRTQQWAPPRPPPPAA